MAKYILVYEDCEGTHAMEFGTNERELHKAVQELVQIQKDDFKVIYAGFLSVEYRYKTIEYAIKVEPEII